LPEQHDFLLQDHHLSKHHAPGTGDEHTAAERSRSLWLEMDQNYTHTGRSDVLDGTGNKDGIEWKTYRQPAALWDQLCRLGKTVTHRTLMNRHTVDEREHQKH
jgi:hypothetical protein